MSMTRQTILASRPAALVLAMSLVAGLSAPFIMLPTVHAAPTLPDGTTELSATPVNQTTAVPPNLAITFDDSGSMAWDFLSDNPPFLTVSGNQNVPLNVTWDGQNADTGNYAPGGPWYCAGVINPTATSGIGTHVMNGVYYNPNITYVPPIHANGTSFPNADATLTAVWNDGDTWNRTMSSNTNDGTTNFTTTSTGYWNCPYDYTQSVGPGNGYYLTGTYAPNNNQTSPVSGSGGGPYYYQLTASALSQLTKASGNLDAYGNPTLAGLNILYNASNWQAVPVPASQYQNWANWWAYYRTHNQAARTALSRVFGSPSLAAKTANGGYGNDIRVVWQNLNNGTFKLPSNAIISALIDTAGCSTSNPKGNTNPIYASPSGIQQSGITNAPPACYRSAFFNWLFQVGAGGSTPTRSALDRAGKFFERGGPLEPKASRNYTPITPKTLEDPYWQPPQTGAYNATSNPGNELYCRQNFHLLLTDGLWNQDTNFQIPALPASLPDGVAFPTPSTSGTGNVTSIYAPVHDQGLYASLSDLALQYWATDLRPDLYLGGTGAPNPGNIVPPYLPDTRTGLFGAGNVSGGNGAAQNIPAEEYFNPKNDPATWPHMSEYLIGMGVTGQMNFSQNTDCTNTTDPQQADACDLRMGTLNSTGAVGWPQPNSMAANGNGLPSNIDDTWHAALAGRGQFFSAGNPQQLVNQLTSVLSNISARASQPTPAAVNASVATVGALSFETSYKADWSGTFAAVTLNSDGTAGNTLWSADIPSASSRNVYTDSYKGGTFSSFAFTTGNVGSLDASENTAAIPASGSTAGTPGLGLQSPTLAGTNDTVANRINYLRGDQSHETDGTYRKRTSLLGAIINSQPVYVAYPSGNYYNNWPAGSPEAVAAAASNGHDDKSYDSFVADHATRPGTVYVGANDGMLHAFNAPVPQCTSYDAATGICAHYDSGTNPGLEDWAFIPRAVYANLGNLTSVSNFQYRPTVDATPVTRDVFFDGDNTWHTLLAGGVGLGGRGVYALDITQAPTTQPTVLWEFDSDIPIPSSDNCQSIQGSTQDSIGCRATDLGFTVSQPNIGRLANGKWVVLVPNGYFPDCSKPDIPTADKTSCQAIAAQAPKDSTGKPYSALFVLDAETGKVIAELKTPTDINLKDGKGPVTSFGLATPVMGDYQNDQIDDVAFAGDLQGNLWRFDLSSSSPSGWSVTLVYQGIDDANGNQGLQPITTMPRLFPDPSTNRFMVVFGTGKYLGAGDNGNNAVQSLYGVRDPGACASDGGCAVQQSDLVQQYMHETVVPSTLPDGSTPPNAGATLRCVTGGANDNCTTTATAINPVPASAGGWRIDLATYFSGAQTDSGERVVVSPGAIFASNTVVFETLIAGASGSDPCNPATQGAILALNSNTGGPSGVSSLGGWPIAGGRINNARTGGSLPIVSALGGGQAYLPGTALAPNGKTPLSIDAPIWRRRSWSEINQN